MTTESPHPFPTDGLRKLSDAEARRRMAAMACTLPKNTRPSCSGQMFVGIFFDGTGNNMDNDYIKPPPEKRKHTKAPALQRRRRWRTAATLALSLMLAACGDRATGNSSEESDAVSYVAVNHTDKWVTSIIVNGEGGILNSPPQGGGGEMCCVTLPRVWRPGLKVTVKWQGGGTYKRDSKGHAVLHDGVPVVIEDPWKSRTVDVPEYKGEDVHGQFHIHFFQNDEVKVLRTVKGAWRDPSYPYPYPTKTAPLPEQP